MGKTKFRATRLEVDLSIIRNNISLLRGFINKDCELIAVVKGNAYSLGVEKIAPLLEREGCKWFAVATPDEAIELRDFGISSDILVLGPSPKEASEIYIQEKITPTLTEMDFAKFFNNLARKKGLKIPLHLAIDTGLAREGFLPEELPAVALELAEMKNVVVEGVYTHFATANEEHLGFTELQFKRFKKSLQILKRFGINPKMRHVCNSAATAKCPQMHLEAVRVGSAIYGFNPHLFKRIGDIKESFSVKSVISLIREIPVGVGVGYGLRYVTRDRERIGIIPIGYRDGFSRLYGSKVTVLVRGHRIPVVGNICMDYCFVDLSDAGNVNIGNEVVIIGDQEGLRISANEMGEIIGTSGNEIISMFSDRVPRVYIE
jgi:alanine racemase